eukprot:281525-Amphidinium_carterae.1
MSPRAVRSLPVLALAWCGWWGLLRWAFLGKPAAWCYLERAAPVSSTWAGGLPAGAGRLATPGERLRSRRRPMVRAGCALRTERVPPRLTSLIHYLVRSIVVHQR